jgi:hypothetical protein
LKISFILISFKIPPIPIIIPQDNYGTDKKEERTDEENSKIEIPQNAICEITTVLWELAVQLDKRVLIQKKAQTTTTTTTTRTNEERQGKTHKISRKLDL